MDYPSRPMSLEERQRRILEKGLKRRPQRDDSYDRDSASGEDPLAATGPPSLPHAHHQQRQRTPTHSRVLETSRSPSVAPLMRSPVHKTPQRSLAVVLTPIPIKNRDDFVALRTDEPVLPRKAAEDSSQPQPRPRPAAAATPSSAPGQQKRRGRPRGWKPGMAYTDLRPRVANSSGNPSGNTTGQKRRGRPPKPTSPPPKELYRQASAEFFAFLCEWRGCRAELHNLPTLRRHVHVVHGEEGSRHGCQWGSCQSGTAATTGTAGRSFRKHIEEQHLIPVAWHVGDGPRHQGDGITPLVPRRASDGGREIPRWLMDEHGRQVTEGIWDQQVEDKAAWRRNRMKLRELLIRRDENLPSEDEEAVENEEGVGD
ncbi:hypothetical protein NLU13_5204 [Sarocladium strictum]|uniref:C2H2-type domain-containing protein n=1 Tax=Sarocladium strictum TaxID=5046 RepID=A0AA39GH17_SARSR|nr:hypothetical protein NLU13_5204 [Sarocladium strictum]